MKMYGSAVSPYVARIVIAARAKGIAMSVEAAPGGGIKSPEYLALNPMGKMPLLDDNGFPVAESGVILEYLEDAGGGKSLLPTDAKGRAVARTICRITDLYLMAQTGAFFRNMNPAARNQPEVDAAVVATRKALADLEHYVSAQGPYLCGKELTIADCTVLPSLLMCAKFMYGAFGLGDALNATPKLSRWFSMMQADATWGPFCKEYCDGFAAFLKSRTGG